MSSIQINNLTVRIRELEDNIMKDGKKIINLESKRDLGSKNPDRQKVIQALKEQSGNFGIVINNMRIRLEVLGGLPASKSESEKK